MPTTHQQGHSDDYESEAHKFIQTKPGRVLLSIRFTTEAQARDWLGAWNDVGENEDVRDHLIAEVQRLEGEA